MVAFSIKGVRIGAGRPKTIVSLMAGDAEACMREIDRLRAGESRLAPDLVEWRADFFGGLSDHEGVARICRQLCAAFDRQPLIFTCRTKGQGGQIEAPADEYASLVREVISRGCPDLVDIELGLGDELVRELVELAREHGVRTIVSHHDFSGTPETKWMAACLEHMAELGADIPKLAVMAHTSEDAERLMEATRLASAQLATPLLTMAMGEPGAITRISGERFGSALTFCALGRASAPGQVELGEAIAAMGELHARLCTDSSPD